MTPWQTGVTRHGDSWDGKSRAATVVWGLKAELTGRSCFRSVGQTSRTFHRDTSAETRQRSVFLNGLTGSHQTAASFKVASLGLKRLFGRCLMNYLGSSELRSANGYQDSRKPGSRKRRSYRLLSAWGSRTRSRSSRSSHTNPQLTRSVAIRAAGLSGHSALASGGSPAHHPQTDNHTELTDVKPPSMTETKLWTVGLQNKSWPDTDFRRFLQPCCPAI